MEAPPMTAAQYDDVFFTADELATRWRMEVGTLANQRHHGTGAPWIKTPSGKVLYRVADILAAENKGQRGWTRETVTAGLETFVKLDAKTQLELRKHLVEHVTRS
jgi:hypothetical protein